MLYVVRREMHPAPTGRAILAQNNALGTRPTSENHKDIEVRALKGNAVKDFFSVKTGLDGEWGI